MKAEITLPNGTTVVIDGTPVEVQSLLDHYGSSPKHSAGAGKESDVRSKSKRRSEKPTATGTKSSDDSVDTVEIVNAIKNCDEAEAIETQILDRASQVDRVLLPLFIVHEKLDNKFGLSSVDIASITRALGVPIAVPNVSNTLSGTASKYVMSDRVRKKGAKPKYKLSRRGVAYIKSVIDGADAGE